MRPFHIFLFAFLALSVLFALYLKSLSKGAAGEFGVKVVMLLLNKNKYKKFHNITVSDGDKTVQIDHIVISQYGIFVVETKNYSGAIYGNETASHFYKYNHGKKYEFYNPIKQNYGHIFALKNVLGDYKYVSAIVFSGYGKLKVESKTFVGYIGDLPKFIKTYKEKIYSETQVDEIAEKLKELSLKGLFVNHKHVKEIQERKQMFQEKISNNICPKCGSLLVERRGQYGKFLGCSSYPKCKFLQK